MVSDREYIFSLLRKKMEDAGFCFEKTQTPHFQDIRKQEFKFIHPELDKKFTSLGLNNRAKKFYIKPLSDEEKSEIGLTTGKTSPLFSLENFPEPNAIDTYKNSDINAWVNSERDNSLDLLLYSIREYVFATLNDIDESFTNELQYSMARTSEERLERLKNASKNPKQIIVKTLIYKRNSDVLVEALYRAKGVCESCGVNAPFTRKKDLTPYLEVHHIVQLSKGGEDTLDNAIAICPNCHREKHFG